ncbi:hypothetical protein MYX76_12155, partial [Desulfobacterota bacterium AH_259_B03_O07]|nr:hypothetical protein [Desulfobacterota bacterium AH_259_B03_O07]
IDFGNFLNARLNHFLSKRIRDKMRLRSKKLSSSYLTSKVVTRNIPQTPEQIENGMLIPALDRQGWIWLCKDHITQA